MRLNQALHLVTATEGYVGKIVGAAVSGRPLLVSYDDASKNGVATEGHPYKVYHGEYTYFRSP